MSGVKVNIRGDIFYKAIQDKLKDLNIEVVVPHNVHPSYSVRGKTSSRSRYYDEIFRYWDNYKHILEYVRTHTSRSGAITRLVKALKRKISGKGKDEDILKAAEDLIKDPIRFSKFGKPAKSTLETRKNYGMGPLFIDSGETLNHIKGRFKK